MPFLRCFSYILDLAPPILTAVGALDDKSQPLGVDLASDNLMLIYLSDTNSPRIGSPA